MDRIMEIPFGTDKIHVRKEMNKTLGEARKNAKPAVCILCGKPQTSFCKSHSVPQMSLRSIADNGIVLHASAVMGMDEEIVDIENGVSKSGTFNYICRSCDGSFFQDYENPDKMVLYPTDKMLAEIAVKNFLLQLSKRANEKEMIGIQQRDSDGFDDDSSQEKRIKEMDFAEYEAEVKFHKNIADTDETGGYQILFWDVLPYTVPIAMQSAIVLTKDLEDAVINNIYDFDPSTRMQYLHLAVLPVNGKSVILAFYHKRDRGYKKLRNQINSMSKDNVLKYINYLIFACTENYYISKTIQTEIEANESLQKLSGEVDGYPSLGILNFANMFGIGYTPVTQDEIPNFLSSEWAL